MALLYVVLANLLIAFAFGQGSQTKNSCVTPGIMCSDCNTRASCLQLGDNFLMIEGKCKNGTHCLSGVCVPGAKCVVNKFKCNQEGLFPDPFDCTKRHYCMKAGNELKNVEMSCGKNGGSFDFATNLCGSPMNSPACVERPVPECKIPLQYGVLKSNPSYFYLCLEENGEIRTELYRCPPGLTFNVNKMSCV